MKILSEELLVGAIFVAIFVGLTSYSVWFGFVFLGILLMLMKG